MIELTDVKMKSNVQISGEINVCILINFWHFRTDFYIVKSNPGAKFGFPSGYAEQATQGTFRKWQKLSSVADQDCTL